VPENNDFTEMCSGSEAGSYSRSIDFVYHSTLGLRVIKKKKRCACRGRGGRETSLPTREAQTVRPASEEVLGSTGVPRSYQNDNPLKLS